MNTLRRLYFVRFAFAVVWAGLLLLTATPITAVTVTVLVLYPVFDVVAAVADTRRSTRPSPVLYVNIVISLAAAVGLAFVAPSDILRVWGTWAILSGLTQLAVGASRRSLGGQWPMIISGAISVVAGTSFIFQGSGLSTLAGYATLGGIFFLVSALRLSPTAKKVTA